MSARTLSERGSRELYVWVRLLRGYAGLTGDLNARLQEEHGLTINDYEVLLLLSHADERRMRRVDLARAVKLSASGVTRLLDGLQKQGYVDRATCTEDARVTYAVLTEAGLAKLREASESHLEAIRATLSDRYSAKELDALAELLLRLPGAADGDPFACEPS